MPHKKSFIRQSNERKEIKIIVECTKRNAQPGPVSSVEDPSLRKNLSPSGKREAVDESIPSEREHSLNKLAL